MVALFRTVDRELGPLDGLVNNAGTTGPVSKIDAVTSAIIDDVMGVNVRGMFLATREAALRMATDRGGRGGAIVNLSSRASEIGGANEFIHYAASKGATDSLTIGAAKELAPRGIRVNAVNPRPDRHRNPRQGRAARTGAADGEPDPDGPARQRRGSGEGDPVLLLSDEASYVTGALLPVSGGR